MVAREKDETPIIDLFLQFCSRCQLQNVPNVRVEHVEKHVVLVSIQLHWSQLFSETGEKLNNVTVIIQQIKCIPDGLVCKIQDQKGDILSDKMPFCAALYILLFRNCPWTSRCSRCVRRTGRGSADSNLMFSLFCCLLGAPNASCSGQPTCSQVAPPLGGPPRTHGAWT